MRFKGASSESNDFLKALEAAAGDFLRTGTGEIFTEDNDFLIKGAGDFLTFFSGTGDLEAGLPLEDLGKMGSGDFFFASAAFLAL